MLLLAFVAAAVAAAPLFRGRLTALADLRFRAVWLIIVALGIQVVIITLAPGARTPLRSGAYVASYLIAIVFLLLNRRTPGLWLVGAGAAMNLVAIVANGGVMPAAQHALAVAGLPTTDPVFFTNSAPVAHPHLSFLGDVFAVPASWPFSNVFSAGDICIALGAAITIHRVTGSRLTPSGTGQFTSLMRDGGFMPLWCAQVVSNLGDWIYWLAVSITLQEQVKGPAFAAAMSGLFVAQFAPSAVFGALFAGPIIDRHSRKKLMIGADAVRAAAVGSLLLVQQPSLAHFYIVAACLGLFGMVFQPSLMASIPNVVSESQVVAANAMVASTLHIAIMMGPAIGAWLMASFGPQTAFGVNATSFAVSAFLILAVRMPWGRPEKDDSSSPARDLVDGMRYIASNRLVRGIILIVGLILLAVATKAPLESVFVRDVLSQGAGRVERTNVLAQITMAWGLGMLLGAVAAPALARRWHRERLLALSIGVVGLAVLAVARTTDFATVLLAWVLAGTANSIGNVSYESLLQERTPDIVRGRVFAATETVLDGSYLAGAFLAGVLGTWLHVTGAFTASAAILLVAAALTIVLLPQPGSELEPEPRALVRERAPVGRGDAA